MVTLLYNSVCRKVCRLKTYNNMYNRCKHKMMIMIALRLLYFITQSVEVQSLLRADNGFTSKPDDSTLNGCLLFLLLLSVILL